MGRSRTALLLQIGIVLQLAHMGEHVVQMIQMHVAGLPPAFAHGVIGSLDLEWVHFLFTLTIACLAVLLIVRWPANPVCWALMPIALWHLAEHTVILRTYLATGITGTPGILAHGGLLNGPLGRPDLHFIYNAAITVLLIGCWYWQARPAPVQTPAPAGRVLGRPVAVATTLAVLLAVSTPVLASAARDHWVGGVRLQAAIDAAPAGATLHLRPGMYRGPLVLRKAITLVGPALLVGGPDGPTVTIEASGAGLSQIDVEGGDIGILVSRAKRVYLEDVQVFGAERRGINIVLGAAQVHRCLVTGLVSPLAWGVAVVNSMGLPATTIEGCRVTGGQEGIVSHASIVFIRGNQVSATTVSGITVTEMSEGQVDGNLVRQVAGTALYCGDRSQCNLEGNTVDGTLPQADRTVDWEAGYGAVVLFYARAHLERNDFTKTSAAGVGVFVGSTLSDRPISIQ